MIRIRKIWKCLVWRIRKIDNLALLLVLVRVSYGKTKTKAEVETVDVRADRIEGAEWSGAEPSSSPACETKGEDDRACVHQGGGMAE